MGGREAARNQSYQTQAHYSDQPTSNLMVINIRGTTVGPWDSKNFQSRDLISAAGWQGQSPVSHILPFGPRMPYSLYKFSSESSWNANTKSFGALRHILQFVWNWIRVVRTEVFDCQPRHWGGYWEGHQWWRQLAELGYVQELCLSVDFTSPNLIDGHLGGTIFCGRNSLDQWQNLFPILLLVGWMKKGRAVARKRQISLIKVYLSSVPFSLCPYYMGLVQSIRQLELGCAFPSEPQSPFLGHLLVFWHPYL